MLRLCTVVFFGKITSFITFPNLLFLVLLLIWALSVFVSFREINCYFVIKVYYTIHIISVKGVSKRSKAILAIEDAKVVAPLPPLWYSWFQTPLEWTCKFVISVTIDKQLCIRRLAGKPPMVPMIIILCMLSHKTIIMLRRTTKCLIKINMNFSQ